MGAVRMIFDETTQQLKEVGWFGELDLDGTRQIKAGRWRYCLQDNRLYLPKDHKVIEEEDKLCWLRARSEEFTDKPWLADFDTTLPIDPSTIENAGFGMGFHYCQRHLEVEGRREQVKELCSQQIIDAIADNPEVLDAISKNDFEALMAEIFVRMGFEVELYRGTKDEGIDFLAIQFDERDPVITCVQCKHPDNPAKGKKKRTLPVATVREIYGVAKAYNFNKCLTITSSSYSPDARKFSNKKPAEIELANREEVLNWIRKYRWNKDE